MPRSSVPEISVVMTVYNGGPYLRSAIDSVLTQTFEGFEFIVVDDASTDETPAVLAEVAASDCRVKVISNEKNLGPYPAANIGLSRANASIIARMDADDICAPNRLAAQFDFLKVNPDHLLIGSGNRAIDHAGNVLYTKANSMDTFAVRWLTRFRNPMPHPAICFRASLCDGTPVRYHEDPPVAQDFELVARLARAGRVASLPAALIDVRIHQRTGITATRRDEQHAYARRIAARSMAHDLPQDLAQRLERFLDVFFLKHPPTPQLIGDIVAAFETMLVSDMAAEPHRRTWFMRLTASLLAQAVFRRGGGAHNPAVLCAFAYHARHFLPALVGRVLENRGYLPSRWGSFPGMSEPT